LRAISPHQPGDRHRLPGGGEDGGEAAAVVQPQVVGVVVLPGQRHPLLAQHPLEHLQMERLVVHQNAVEVEEDGAEHGAIIPGSGASGTGYGTPLL